MATILIAEPVRHLAEPVAAVLRHAGHQPLVAHDGDQAWRIAQMFHIDLLITDRQLPGLGSLALIDRLRGESAYQRLPVLLVGDGGPVPVGVSRIAKPLPLTQLAALVSGLAPNGRDSATECAG